MLIARIADALNDEPPSSQSSHDPEQEVTNPQDGDKSSTKEQDTSGISRVGEDDSSDSESLYGMVTDMRTNSLWPKRFNKRAPLRERIKKAPKRVVQQMAYTQLMEDRVADLEERLRRIESQPETVAPPEGTNRPTDMIVLGLKRMSFQEYLPTKPATGPKGVIEPINHARRHEFPGQLPYHLIDAVFSATHQHERLNNDQGTKPAAGPPDLAATSLAIPARGPMTNDGQFVQPERIRINSVLLLNALRKITSCIVNFNKVPNRDGLELQDQVILRPFKLLVINEKEIRNEIDRLEDLHVQNGGYYKEEAPETAEDENGVPPSLPVTDSLHKIPESAGQDQLVDFKAENDLHTTRDYLADGEREDIVSLDSLRCLEELRVLRELLDTDLRPTFDLRKQIKDGVVRSIAFQDLWHLFPIGGEIVSNNSNGLDQVYRILDVSGGKPFLCEKSCRYGTMGLSFERKRPA